MRTRAPWCEGWAWGVVRWYFASHHPRYSSQVIFIDETCVKTNMTQLRGWSPKGKRFKAHAPAGKWETSSFIAGLRRGELSAPFVVKGAIDGDAFVIYVQTQLVPTLKPDDVVICDNLNVHKNSRAIEAIEAKGHGCYICLAIRQTLISSKRHSRN